MTTIYDLFEATVAQQPDKPAVGLIEEGELKWDCWEVVRSNVRSLQTDLLASGARERSFIATSCLPLCDIAMPAERMVHACFPGQHVGPQLRRVLRRLDADYFFQLKPESLDPPRLFNGPNEVSTVQLTSGSSGEPHAVMLSQENLVSNAIALSDASGGEGDELRLSFLPMDHLYARTCDLYTWIIRGSRLVLAESPKTVFRDAKIVRPTVINGVPYFFQKAIDLADAQGESLRDLLGGEIKRCYCGGAPLAPEVERRFFDEGVPLYTGYGLTEASPVVTVNTPDAHKLGTVGKPLPNVEVQIADDGEILVKGPNVMLGYWNDPEATAEVLRDDWLHTGDLGELDGEGFLTITGRKKELIVLSTGKNVAPSRVEARLCASPWIEQAAVIGDGRKGLGAVIVPNRERVRAEIKRRRIWAWSKRRAVNHPAIREVFRAEIDAALADAPREEQVHAFTVLPRAFDAGRGEITPKLSLRRGVIEKNLAREIRAMFG